MRQDRIYKEVETKCKEECIMERYYGVESFNEGEPYFTTSQETDVWEMIRDGMTSDEIVNNIKMW